MTMENAHARKIGLMPWTRYSQLLQADPPVFLPVGALEQHGPHLPMSCDALLAEAMADGLAEQLQGLVLPSLAYGYKSQPRSGGGQCFPGTTSLDGQTLTAQVRDIVRELARHGARKLIIINGHVENQWFVTEGIDLALREIKPAGDSLRVWRCEYWNYTPQSTLDRVFDGPFPGVDLEHAALLETSMMLALHPHLVDMSALPPDQLAQFPGHDSYPVSTRHVPDSGVLAPTRGASAEKGELLIRTTLAAMADALAGELG